MLMRDFVSSFFIIHLLVLLLLFLLLLSLCYMVSDAYW